MNKFKLLSIVYMTLICSLLFTIISFAMTDEEKDFYNHELYPKSIYNDGINRSPQDATHNFSVSPASGSSSVTITDISLAGKNGLDVSLTRNYNSSQANLLEPYVDEIAAYSTVNYYKVVGKKDYYKKNYSGTIVSQGTNVTICINNNYNNYTDSQDNEKYYNLASFEYADATTPNASNLFANYSDALALANKLNNTYPDINASEPYADVLKYWANYYNFTVTTVPISVYTPIYATSLLPDTSNERHFKLGAGWSFNFPYIEKRYGEGEFEYLHYGDKGTYEIDFTSNGGTNHLAGYTINDIIIEYDSSITHDGKISKYVLTEKNGTKSYFANDGRLLIIRDRFANEVKFYHDTDVFTDTRGINHNYPYLSKIVDTVGREITFNYTTLLITVSINDTTNSANNRAIKYTKQKIVKSGVVDEYILYSVEKPNGDKSTYTYNTQASPVTFFDRNNSFYNANYTTRNANMGNSYINSGNFNGIIGIKNYYALLEYVSESNGREYRFYYSKFLKNCTTTGSMMFFKAYWSSDDVRRDENDIQYEANGKQYYYNINNTGEYDGYPSYKRDTSIGASYRINTKLINKVTLFSTSLDNNISEETYTYRYTGIDDTRAILLDNITRNGGENKSTTDFAYYETTNLQSQVLNKNYNSPTSTAFMTTQDNYTYDTGNYGDVLTHTENNDTNHITTYTYNPTYHYITTKSYKKDSDTTMLEEFTPKTGDERVVEWQRIKENGLLKKQVQLSHDSSGNITEERQYLDNQIDYIAKQYSYLDNVTVRNGKFNGLYLTKETVLDVKDADDSNSRNIEKNYTYNWFGDLVALKDAKEQTTLFEYDKISRKTREINPNTSFKKWDYLDHGMIVEISDEDSKKFTKEYDTSNNLILEYTTSSSNPIRRYYYNSFNQPIKIIDYSNYGNQTITLYDYDSLLRPTYKEVRNNENAIVYRETYDYNVADSNGLYNKETVTIASGVNSPAIVKSSFKDKFGNIVRVEAGADYETLVYNYIGQNTNIKSARANNENWTESYTDKFEYNFLGKVVKQYNVLNDNILMEYDTLGRLVKKYDILGNKATLRYATEYKYDNLGRVVQQKTPFEKISGSIVYSVKKIYYDNNGNIIKEKMTNNSPDSATTYAETSYDYDAKNRLIKTISNDGEKTYYTQNYYALNGNLLRVYTGLTAPLTINSLDNVTPNGDVDYAVTKYEYDSLGRVNKITDPMGMFEGNTYDLKGTVDTSTDKNGNTFKYEYDALNNLKVKSLIVNTQKTDVITTTYGANGKIATASNADSNIIYEYDNLARLVTETVDGVVKAYTYDSANNRKTFTLTKNGVQMSVSYDYDKLNRLWKVYENNILQATYLYDDNGNRFETTIENIGITNYTHNLANMLTSQISGTLLQEQFAYFLSGNQKSKTSGGVTTNYQYDNINRLKSENDTIYKFDDYGNRHKKQEGATSETTYNYDKNNRLRSQYEVVGDITNITKYYYDKNGNQTGSSKSNIFPYSAGTTAKFQISEGTNDGGALYRYNAYNQMIEANTRGVTSKYTYDAVGLRNKKNVGETVIGIIYDGASVVAETNSSGAVENKYLRGHQIIKCENGNIFYIYNGQGDVVKLINTSLAVVADYEYDAYGNQQTGNNTYNPFRFRGEYMDLETSLIYLRARYYDPATSRMLSEDPARDGTNWYIYANNNPLIYHDPTGLFAENTKLSYNQNYNPDVVKLQRQLVSLGYLDMSDGNGWGCFGPKTQAAVNKYKGDKGLWNFDGYKGVVGKTTWEHMGLKLDYVYENQMIYTGTPEFYQKGFFVTTEKNYLSVGGRASAGQFGGAASIFDWGVQLFDVNAEIGINKGGTIGAEAAVFDANGAINIPLPNGKTLVIEISGSVGSIGATLTLDLEKGIKAKIAYGAGAGIGIKIK